MLNICGKPISLVNTNLEPELAEPIKPFTAYYVCIAKLDWLIAGLRFTVSSFLPQQH